MSKKHNLKKIIDDLFVAHPHQAKELVGGAKRLKGFFLGKVMLKTKGDGDIPEARRLLDEKIETANTGGKK